MSISKIPGCTAHSTYKSTLPFSFRALQWAGDQEFVFLLIVLTLPMDRSVVEGEGRCVLTKIHLHLSLETWQRSSIKCVLLLSPTACPDLKDIPVQAASRIFPQA